MILKRSEMRISQTSFPVLPHKRPFNIRARWTGVPGFGVSVAEAMASGSDPVVSATDRILDQVQDSVNGLLFAPDDDDAQARAMLPLARDEPFRRRLDEGARHSARGTIPWDREGFIRILVSGGDSER